MSLIRPLKLAALDEEDLKILSAHVQDAVVKVADIRWTRTSGAFLMPMNRFAWEVTRRSRRRSNDQRRRAVLHFDRVRRVQSAGVSPRDREAVLSLLAILFEASDPPAGTIVLPFAGGTTMRLEVECVEARLTDLGAAWSAPVRPKHPVGGVL